MTREQALDKLREMIAGIKPRIIMGDDDSIYLTDRQEGMKEALSVAISIVEQIDDKTTELAALKKEHQDSIDYHLKQDSIRQYEDEHSSMRYTGQD